MAWFNDLIDDNEFLPDDFFSDKNNHTDDIVEALLKTHTFQEWVGYVPNSQLKGNGKFHINETNSLDDFLKDNT